MTAVVAGSGQRLRATLLRWGDADRRRCEHQLTERGVPVPLMHRIAWTEARPGTQTWFIALRDAVGNCRYGVAVQVARSRALPGHLLMRLERLDPAVDPDACRLALRTLADLARRRWPRVLRVYVELYSADEGARRHASGWLRELGFRPAEHARMYRRTALVDLSGDDETMFARLHRSARRNVRAIAGAALEVRPITDPGLAPRIEVLIREAFARTGGAYESQSWAPIIEMSAREPDLSRIAGLFRTDVAEPDALLAFEWACMHGDHAQSIAAGSTRATEVRAPLAYALVWDIMRWARERGARYLDFGGITAGDRSSSDRLGGISEFKRFFGGSVAEVGEEWIFEPHPTAARVASALTRAFGTARRIRARFSRRSQRASL